MGLNGERRQDVGLKMVYSLLTGIIAIMLTVFFMKTYNLAEGALLMGNENKKDVAVLQTNFAEISRRLVAIDIKLDRILIK